jgi:tryptophan-rich sensory protein
MREKLGLLMAILICEGAGLVGSFFTITAIPTWYPALAKPVFNPPDWIFGPVWTILYALMGWSLFLVWRKLDGKKKTAVALDVFVIQLSLNVIWSVLFFGLQQPGLALFEIILLWMSIVWTYLVFRRISRPAAALLLPYLAWVTFATYLNASIWWLNR